jgi:hypothetical protein
MTAIDIIHAIVASGTSETAEIAKELTKRGVPPPTSDGCTARDVSRIYAADAWHRVDR